MISTWLSITEMPEDGKFYTTAIWQDGNKRNECLLRRQGNLFFTKDGMYIYYVPTHYLK